MNQNNDEKYVCPVCNAEVKNIKKNILQHNKTKKHLDALNGEERKPINKTRAEKQAEYRAKLKEKIGEAEFKEKQKIQKQKQRAKYKEGEEKIVEEIKDYQKEVRDKVKDIVKNVNDIIRKERDEPSKDLEEIKEIEKKLEDAVPKVELNGDCLQVVENMYQAGKRYAKGDMNVKIDGKKVFVTKKSIMQYHKTIHKWYKRFYGEKLVDCSDLSWLKQDLNKFVAFIMKEIKNNARDKKNYQNSLTSNVSDITGYLKRLRGYDEEYKTISSLLKVNVNKRQKLLETNEPNQQQQERFISFDKLKSYADGENGTSKQRLLYGLYTFFVRRIQDYRLMKIYKMKKKDTLGKVKSKIDKSYNYIIVSNTNNPHTFVFNNYKQSVKEKLGQQSFQIPAEIKPFIVEYVQDNEIKSGDILFTKKDGGPQSDSTFSTEVSNAFKEITGVTLSVNDIRHITAGYFINRRPALSKKELTEQAYKMAQSNYDTLYSYYKKNEDE